MTKVYIFKKNDLICGFQVKGHSGYAENGSDIVCASISTASQMTVLGLEQVQGLSLHCEKREAFLSAYVDENDLPKAQTLLCTFQKTVEEIAKDHAKFVKLEVRNDS